MFAPAWVKDAIFYQIFPDRFCRSERYHAAGKFVEWGSKPTRENMFGGNLAGIEDKLEYIKNLGANAIYLCPIFKSNSNHRYHTVDYFEIDPVLGTLKDFDRDLYWSHAQMTGKAPEKLTPPVVRDIIAHVFSSNSMFCILPVQDYFALSSTLSEIPPEEERVNIPGTVGGNNWTYRLPLTVEDLETFTALNSEIRKLVDTRRRRPMWKI